MKSALKLLFLALLSTQCLGMSSLKNGFAKAWAYARTVGARTIAYAAQQTGKPQILSKADRAVILAGCAAAAGAIAYNQHQNKQTKDRLKLDRLKLEGSIFLRGYELQQFIKQLTAQEEDELAQRAIHNPELFCDMESLCLLKLYRAYLIQLLIQQQLKPENLSNLIQNCDEDELDTIANAFMEKPTTLNHYIKEFYQLCWFKKFRTLLIHRPTLLSLENCGRGFIYFFVKRADREDIERIISLYKKPSYPYEHSRSFQQICANKHRLALFLLLYANNPQISNALIHESFLNQQGKTVFYHGQASKWGIYQIFVKKLLQELYQQQLLDAPLRGNFLLIQTPEELFNDENTAHKSKDVQQKLLRGTSSVWESQELHHLYSTLFLFANYPQMGLGPLYFMETNTNEKHSSEFIDWKQILLDLKIPIKDNYIKTLQEFEIGMFNLSTPYSAPRGRLLQIAIPNDKVDDYSYKTISYNPINKGKTSEELYNYTYINTSQFTNTNQFVIPLSIGGALNPHNTDIEVYAYDPEPTDPALHKEFNEKIDKLVKDIVADVKQQEQDKAPRHLCCTSIVDSMHAYKTKVAATPSM